MKILRLDGKPTYDADYILYQIQVNDIPSSIDIKEIVAEESKHNEDYNPNSWFVRGVFDYEDNSFHFDNCLIYIRYDEYFYDYEFKSNEIMEMIKLCIENTDYKKINKKGEC